MSLRKLIVLVMVATSVVTSHSLCLADDLNKKCYTIQNPYFEAGFKDQCTWLAWGRACEKMGIQLRFNRQDYPSAKNWWYYGPVQELHLATSSQIQADSIAVWQGDSTNPDGHVAYVERIERNMVYFHEANTRTGPPRALKQLPLDKFQNRGEGIRQILGYIYLNPPSIRSSALSPSTTAGSTPAISQQRAPSQTVTPPKVEATQPTIAPMISSVSPNPVPGADRQQPFTIYGSDFSSAARVILRDLSTKETFDGRAAGPFTNTRIVLSTNFTTDAHRWSVEVINPDGKSSGQYCFNVVAPNNVAASVPQASAYVQSIPVLKWPLAGNPPLPGYTSDREIAWEGNFGDDWLDSPEYCCGGLPKKHVGVDLKANTAAKDDEPVYAAEDGIVKRKFLASPTNRWGEGIVISHSQGFTTVYLHVVPLVAEGEHVVRGQQIAVIDENVDFSPHLHFGVRNAEYSEIAQRGALPQKNSSGPGRHCDDLLFSQSRFVDPMTLSYGPSLKLPDPSSILIPSTNAGSTPPYTEPADSTWGTGTAQAATQPTTDDGSSARPAPPSYTTPRISSLSPNPITGSYSSQPFTIYGSNFVNGANVILRDVTTGEIFPNRTASSLSAGQIVLNPVFTIAAHRWSVEVINPDGKSSGQYNFNVVAPASPQPSISSVSPNPVIGSNSSQSFTVYGGNFVSGANIVLRDVSAGQVFERRPASSFTSNQIVLNPNFTASAARWSIEVINPDGKSSGQYYFNVVAPAVPPPAIDGVSPNPVTGSNYSQPFLIYGSNFVTGANVILRDVTAGQIFERRTASSFSSNQILINPNFTANIARWSVEVINPDGKSSGQFFFNVR